MEDVISDCSEYPLIFLSVKLFLTRYVGKRIERERKSSQVSKKSGRRNPENQSERETGLLEHSLIP
jgi:hypothetical protein